MITEDDKLKAIARIARTPDGVLLYLWLEKQLLGVPGTIDPHGLTVHHGERRFAAQLMGLMSEAIAEQAVDGRDSLTGAGLDTRPIVFATRQPAGTKRLSPREYLAALSSNPESTG